MFFFRKKTKSTPRLFSCKYKIEITFLIATVLKKIKCFDHLTKFYKDQRLMDAAAVMQKHVELVSVDNRIIRPH